MSFPAMSLHRHGRGPALVCSKALLRLRNDAVLPRPAGNNAYVLQVIRVVECIALVCTSTACGLKKGFAN